MFVVSRDAVAVARERYPHPVTPAGLPQATPDLTALDRQIADVPHALHRHNGIGVGAIPQPLRVLAGRVAALVAGRTVKGLFPHATLHALPWRTLLREHGVPWDRLACATEFSFLLRGWPGERGTSTVSRAVAAGHGSAPGVDFRDEAKAFADTFGAGGTLLPTCTAGDVTRALACDAAAIVSTHGVTKERPCGKGRGLTLAVQGDDLDRTVDAFLADHLPARVRAPVVVLSACWSGVYEMGWGDYPVGAGPLLLLKGARYCVVCRFPVRAAFARAFAGWLGRRLAAGAAVPDAVAGALADAEAGGWDRWHDVACIELLARP